MSNIHSEHGNITKKLNVSPVFADDYLIPVVRNLTTEGKTLSEILTLVNPPFQKLYDSIVRVYEQLTTPSYTLRSYQSSATNKVLTQWQTNAPADTTKTTPKNRNNKAFIELPTGAGKTLVMYHIINEYINNINLYQSDNTQSALSESKTNKPPCIIILSPRIKLCEQHVNAKNLEYLTPNGPFTDHMPAIINSKANTNLAEMIQRYRAGKPIIVSATYQSILRLRKRLALASIQPTLVFADEAHLISDWSHAKNANADDKQWFFSLPKHVFMTATPKTHQKNEIMLENWGTYIRETTVGELIHQGILSEIVTLIPNIRYDTDDGCMSKKHLCEVMHKSITRYKRKKSVVFCNTQARCIQLMREFDAINRLKPVTERIEPFVYIGNGFEPEDTSTAEQNTVYGPQTQEDIANDVLAELMDELSLATVNEDDTTDAELASLETVKQFEAYSRGPAVLFVCKKISMGYDFPPIDFIAFADPKCSKCELAQCIGRGLRMCPGKDKCYVFIPITPIDYAVDTSRKTRYKTVFEYIDYLKSNIGYEIEDIIRVLTRRQEPNGNTHSTVYQQNTQELQTTRHNSFTYEAAELGEDIEYINPNDVAVILQNECVYREGCVTYKSFVKTLQTLGIDTPEKYNGYMREPVNKNLVTFWPETVTQIYERWSGFKWIEATANNIRNGFYATKAECEKHINALAAELMLNDEYNFWNAELKYKKMREIDPKLPHINYLIYYG